MSLNFWLLLEDLLELLILIGNPHLYPSTMHFNIHHTIGNRVKLCFCSTCDFC